MRRVVSDLVPPVALRNAQDSYWRQDVKASELLDRIFEAFFRALELPNVMRKTAYHRLASLARPEEVDQEVTSVLDQIVETAQHAQPGQY